jgi:hypothetical protein
MGWGKAAQNTDAYTRMAMMAQMGQAQQAENALRQGQQQATAAYDPYQKFGVESTNRLATLMGLRPGEGSGSLMTQPTIEQLQMDPGYAFREQQGMQAVNRTAAAQAGLQSGAALNAAQRFGQELGSQEYGNAYNRFMANRANQMALLQGGTQTGFGAAQGIGNAAIGTGTNLAQNYQNLGQGLGQGYANIGSAYANAAMGPTNLLAALAGQGLQGAMMAYGMNRPPTTPNSTIVR